uniref:Uncharacterized protein n=1 Tax=Neogobius melanostomus TaxID=47308 RepID=A0A8C6SGD1_9GOBI
MASSETVNIQQADVVINRWLVDYYLVLAIDMLERKQYNDFCAIRNVLDYVLSRPLESANSTPKNIRVLNFLTWINKGNSLVSLHVLFNIYSCLSF